MTVYAVDYEYAVDSDALRDEHRASHRDFLRGFIGAEGDVQLIAAGAYSDTETPGALLLFVASDAAALNAVLADDPFALVGAITATQVRPWVPGLGELSGYAN